MKAVTLTNHELLKQLFGRATGALPRRDLSLKEVFSSRGPLAIKCELARELVRRWLDEELRSRLCLSEPARVKEYLNVLFAGQEHESFRVMFLDAQNRLIVCEELFRGTLTQAAVYPREILKAALRHNAAAVVLAHNHPSGISRPSQADRHLTDTLRQALALVDIQVLDHFIVAGRQSLSFAEHGWL